MLPFGSIDFTTTDWLLFPGILAFLVTLVGGMLSALNIVSEKEIGTIEQINVSPSKKSTFILGNLFLLDFGKCSFYHGTFGFQICLWIEIYGSLPLSLFLCRSLSFSHFRIRLIDFHL